MNRQCAVVLVVLGAASVAGCGSSPLAVPKGGVHSSTRKYSVRQVEAVFRAQGIGFATSLRRTSGDLSHCSTCRPSHKVDVYVTVGKFTGALDPPIAAARVTRHGNLEILWRPPNGNEVEAALATLH